MKSFEIPNKKSGNHENDNSFDNDIRPWSLFLSSIDEQVNKQDTLESQFEVEEEEREEEVRSLLDSRERTFHYDNFQMQFMNETTFRWINACNFSVMLCLVFVGVLIYTKSENYKDVQHIHLPVSYSCPKLVQQSKTDHNGILDIYKVREEKDFLSHYRTKDYEGWAVSYLKMKKILRPWKKKVLKLANLQSGDLLYESAMGRGLNLLMTAEFLAESSIDGVFVYGNDYLKDSIRMAKSLWGLPEVKRLSTKPGIFCVADSIHLAFIPDSTFDFVFTGYLEPLSDPMHLEPDGSTNSDVNNCLSTNTTSSRLSKTSQKLQEEWFSSWITEMSRITKPGKYISVEMIGYPLCQSTTDWGGVSKQWWLNQAYFWGIDPNSIIFEDCHKTLELWGVERYHILMKKL